MREDGEALTVQKTVQFIGGYAYIMQLRTELAAAKVRSWVAIMSSDCDEMPLLELRLFGSPSILVEGSEITRALPKKAVLLLALLALEKGKPMDRSQLAGMLWPDVSDPAALHNLRQMLSGIRRTLGVARETIQSPTLRSIALNLAPELKVDVLEFDAGCASQKASDLEAAVRLYRQPLLAGCDEPFVMMARQARQQAFLAAADKLVQEYLLAKDPSKATTLLRRVLAEDPYRETACRALMSSLAATGEWPAALEFYREFRTSLRRDLRADVSDQTKDLYRSIRKNEALSGPSPTHKRPVPTPVTDLIGRQKAISEVVARLNICRLVTLTGLGGVGKTRLAIEIAAEVSEKYLDGACFVDLAPVKDEEIVPMAIASALNVPERAGKPVIEAVAEYLAPRELLLVLDNCEHLAKSMARIVEDLLVHASGLRVLATSREPLGVRGESVSAVPVLPTPAESDGPVEIAQTESVILFLNRSRRPIDSSREKDMFAVASICRRLDGLPLAIELAAARTNVFSPHEIERRLDDRFGLLTAGSKSLHRHETLRECMQWSWELLSSPEKCLLKSMSIFRGGCTFQAIDSTAEQGIGDTAELLGSLIDKSLVAAIENGEQTRYMLLETVREFADQKLHSTDDWPTAYDRYRDYFLGWVEQGYRPMNSVDEARKFAACELEHDNFRASIAWCHRQGDRAKAIRMCAALSRFWDTHGHVNEGRAQLEFALSHEAPDLSEETRGRALVHVGWMAAVQGECDAAIAHYHEALAIAERRNDSHAASVIYNCLANAYIILGDFKTAQSCLNEALAMSRSANPNGVAMILCNLGEVAIHQGEDHVAEDYLQQGIQERGGLSAESATISGSFLRLCSFIRYRKGQFVEARDFALQSAHFFKGAAVLYEIPFALLTMALAETGLGHWERALKLFGACERALSSEKRTSPAYLALAQASALSAASNLMDPAAIEISLAEGRIMSLGAAIEYAAS